MGRGRQPGSEDFAYLDRIVSQILMLLIANGKKILSNMNVVVRGEVKSENSSLPVAVHVSKTRVLKLPIEVKDGVSQRLIPECSGMS